MHLFRHAPRGKLRDKRCRMKIVMMGCGKVGYTLTQALLQEGHDLTVIDQNSSVLSLLEEHLDVMCVRGNSASIAVQKQAGTAEADLAIAVTEYDEVNLISCMTAKKLGCSHTIARVRNPEYSEAYYYLRDELGLNMIVNPERTAAREIFGLLRYPSLLRRDLIAKGRAEIVELPVRPGGKLDGIRLLELYGMLKVRVLVCAVERGDEVFIPNGTFTLHGNDRIYVTAPSDYLLSLIRYIGLETNKIRSVMVLGGSRIGFYLAQMLTKVGISVKMIDIDQKHCEKLSEMLSGVTVVNADATSFDALTDEGIDETDALVSLLNFDEQNIVVSMFANNRKVPKVITKINRTEYGDIMRAAEIECVITPKSLSNTDVLRFVRALENRYGSEVNALHRMVDGKVEALEFRADANTPYLNTPLKDIPLKKNILIAVISHDGNITIPAGDSSYQKGDTIVVVTDAARALGSLNDIFASA